MQAIIPRIIKETEKNTLSRVSQILEAAEEAGSEILESAKLRAKEHYDLVMEHADQTSKAEASAIIVEAQVFRNRLIAENRDLLISLAIAVAEEVIAEANAISHDAITKRIERAIVSSSKMYITTIIVNPNDINIVKTFIEETKNILNTNCITYKEDESLPQGDAIIDTKYGNILVSLRAHIEAIRARLLSL